MTSHSLVPQPATLRLPVAQMRSVFHPGDVERKLEDRWMAAAEKALATNQVTFALLSASNVFGPKSYLAKLKAKGYTVMAPDDQVNADVEGEVATP